MPKIVNVLAALLLSGPAAAEPSEVSFETSDGIEIYGDLYTASRGRSAPLVLLFHQAGGDARGEYRNIAPRLVKAGYNVLAIDQRSGGDRFGSVNRTVANMAGRDAGYCDVYPDLEAALRFALKEGFDGPRAAWGSSYSAALAFQLAARNGDAVDAVLGFSPASGGPLQDCRPAQYLDALAVPALALRPQRELAIESVRAQMERFEASGVETWVADPGVHGASMLDADRVGAPTEQTWAVVLAFLDGALGTD